jgi:hypothetical protein
MIDQTCKCAICGQPIAGEIQCDDQGQPRCEDCYAAYVKAKFGSGNSNPDNYRVC